MVDSIANNTLFIIPFALANLHASIVMDMSSACPLTRAQFSVELDFKKVKMCKIKICHYFLLSIVLVRHHYCCDKSSISLFVYHLRSDPNPINWSTSSSMAHHSQQPHPNQSVQKVLHQQVPNDPVPTTGAYVWEEWDVCVWRNKEQQNEVQCMTYLSQYVGDVNPNHIRVYNGSWKHFPNTFERYVKDFYIRIPALMMFWIRKRGRMQKGYDEVVQRYMETDHQRQMASHLMLQCNHYNDIHNMGSLTTSFTIWEGMPRKFNMLRGYKQREYCCVKPAPIACVYPCYTQPSRRSGNMFKMVLGMCFVDHGLFKQAVRRTYGNRAVKDTNTCAFDLSEDFILGTGSPSYTDKVFCNLGDTDRVIALYICKGARLVVTDKQDPAQPHHCRGLYQQGSVVVVRGKIYGSHLALTSLKTDSPIPGYKDIGVFLYKHMKPEEVVGRDVRPEESLPPIDGNKENVLNKRRALVLFLGPAPSRYNSACWSLTMDNYEGKLVGNLQPPEGGVIIDMSTWDAGFKQIQARHSYERLFESVLSPSESEIGFGIPGEEMAKRILGIDSNALSMRYTITHDDPDLDIGSDFDGETKINPNDSDIRQRIPYSAEVNADRHLIHFERFDQKLKWQDFHQFRVPQPPLYPPIMDNDGDLHYLSRSEKVYMCDEENGNTYYKIQGFNERYALSVERVLTYPWVEYSYKNWEDVRKHIGRPNDEWEDLDIWWRIGSDYIRYLKWTLPGKRGYDPKRDISSVTTCVLKKVEEKEENQNLGEGKDLGEDQNLNKGQKLPKDQTLMTVKESKKKTKRKKKKKK